MSRQQAEQVLRDRRGKAYDPWVVDRFIGILDELEQMDAAEAGSASEGEAPSERATSQLDVIAATTAEEREFGELQRELSRSADLHSAVDLLLRHTKRVVPASTAAFFSPIRETNELKVVACLGVGAATIADSRVEIGERISGWAFAHSQSVLNSDATLELGPVARTLPDPLRYATAVPLVDRRPVAILVVFSSQPLERDHGRLLESAASVFMASVSDQLMAPTATRGRPAAIDFSKARAR